MTAPKTKTKAKNKAKNKAKTKAKTKRSVVLDDESKQQLSDATMRLDKAEQELTLAMNALELPELGAEDVIIGDRVRAALSELGKARQALAVVIAAAR